MNTMCRNIIEKSVIGVLIYAGKRFVDKCFFDKKIQIWDKLLKISHRFRLQNTIGND